MAHAASYITRRGAKYHYRRRVPADVQFGLFFKGRADYRESLRTSDLKEAKRRAIVVDLRFEAEVANMRPSPISAVGVLSPGVDYVLTQADTEAITAAHWATSDEIDRENRRQADLDPEGEWAHHLAGRDEDEQVILTQIEDPLIGPDYLRAYKSGVADDYAEFIERQARIRGVEVGSADYSRIEAAFVAGELAAMRSRRAGWGGLDVEPPSAAIQRGLARRGKPQGSWTLGKLAEEVLNSAQLGSSWSVKVSQVVDIFDGFMGFPKAISEIKRSDVSDFIDLMLRCPNRAQMRYPGATLRSAIALNAARPVPFATIQPNTVRDTHLAVLRSLLGYAASREWISTSPADKIKVRGSDKRGGKRPSFRVEELNDLFKLPLFTGCARPDRINTPGAVLIRDHRFWTPLLMLFSGARPSEIGQLAVSDVKLDAAFPYISFLTEYDANDPEDRPYVLSAKTPNARREIPIHPKLIALGFGQWVASMRAIGSERLFPDWPASNDRRKLYSGARWIRAFNETHIPRVTLRKPRPTFYSFRHTFKVAMSAARVDRAVQNQVMGHANVGMDAHYHDGLAPEDLYSQIASVKYAHLEIDHLVVRSTA